MKNTTFLLFALLALALPSCKKITGSGPIVTSERTATNYTQIYSSIGDKVIITQGSEYKLTVKAQQNIADELETYVENDVLHIKYKKDASISSHKPVEIFINLPQVTDLKLQGSGDIVVLNRLNADVLNLSISGSGNIIGDELIANNLNAEIAGSGDIKVSNGSVDKGDLTISGSGSMELLGLKFRECNVKISGSGNAKVNVDEKLDVNISGSGSVYYLGSPIISQQISGSGSVQKQ